MTFVSRGPCFWLFLFLFNLSHSTDSNLFEEYSSEELAKLGATFFLPYLSRTDLLRQSENTRRHFRLDAEWEPREYYVGALGVKMLSVRMTAANFEQKLLDRLQHHGVVAIPQVVRPEDCAKAADAAVKLISHPPKDASFGSIQKSEYRKDMPLELEEPFLTVLYQALDPVGQVLIDCLGEDAVLAEYSTLTSFPGAEAQIMHADTMMANPSDMKSVARLISCYIYLTDVTEDMAALDVWPGTHTHFHFYPEVALNPLLVHGHANIRAPAVRMVVPMGSMVLFDSRTNHRGSANTSPRVRPTVYFSFMSGSGKPPVGSTFSVKEKYRGLKLRDILSRKIVSMKFQNPPKEDDWKAKLVRLTELMYVHCKAQMRAVWKKKKPTSPQASSDCFACGDGLLIDEHPDFKAFEQTQVERVCKFGIFGDEYKSEL